MIFVGERYLRLRVRVYAPPTDKIRGGWSPMGGSHDRGFGSQAGLFGMGICHDPPKTKREAEAFSEA
jgi:hypothetical protein